MRNRDSERVVFVLVMGMGAIWTYDGSWAKSNIGDQHNIMNQFCLESKADVHRPVIILSNVENRPVCKCDCISSYTFYLVNADYCEEFAICLSLKYQLFSMEELYVIDVIFNERYEECDQKVIVRCDQDFKISFFEKGD